MNTSKCEGLVSSSWPLYPFPGHGEDAHIREGRTHPWMGHQYIGKALCEHLLVRYLTQGYLGKPLKVSWHLPLLPEHLPCFVTRYLQERLNAKVFHTNVPWLIQYQPFVLSFVSCFRQIQNHPLLLQHKYEEGSMHAFLHSKTYPCRIFPEILSHFIVFEKTIDLWYERSDSLPGHCSDGHTWCVLDIHVILPAFSFVCSVCLMSIFVILIKHCYV